MNQHFNTKLQSNTFIFVFINVNYTQPTVKTIWTNERVPHITSVCIHPIKYIQSAAVQCKEKQGKRTMHSCMYEKNNAFKLVNSDALHTNLINW